MLEILILWHFCKQMGILVRSRRREPFNYQILLIALAISGEFLGALIGAVITRGGGMPMYIFALAGAVGGIVSAFKIAKSRLADKVWSEKTHGFPVIQTAKLHPLPNVYPEPFGELEKPPLQ